jgi:hypothetical protein
MTRDKFFNPKGRYESLPTSRFKEFTYGATGDGTNHVEIDFEPRHGTYGALLFDKRWIQRRLQILERDNNKCVICQSTVALQIHHRQYHFVKALSQFKAPWEYEDYLLITLCERCHSKGHGKYRIPNVYL